MQKEAQKEDEEDFLLGEYHSDDETEKPVDTKDSIGGGNLAPEVLKMLQQMAPSTIEPNEENEPDEIKVLLPHHTSSLTLDLLCLPNAFPINSIRRRTHSSTFPTYLPPAKHYSDR